MGFSSAVDAYRQSAYQKLEYDIERSVGSAGLPLLGGTWAELKGIGNLVARPVKMGGALLLGGQYPVDSAHITEAAIPADIQNTAYAKKGLTELRQSGRESADLRAQSLGKLFEGDFGGFFRTRRAASYDDVQRRKVILPDEGSGIVSAIANVGAMVGTQYLGSQLMGGPGSIDMASLGKLSSAIPGGAFKTAVGI